MTEDQWYAKHNCSHAHCPNECEHPQPFMHGDDLICGRCWHKISQRTVMLPCTPSTCD